MNDNQTVSLEEYGLFKTSFGNSGCMGSADQGYANGSFGNDEVTIHCTSMEAGAHSKWHIHPNGSHVIVCTAGRALVQIEGEEAQVLLPGEAVSVPAGVKHWHGAGNNGRAQILVIHAHPGNFEHQFLEPVDEEAYAAL